MLRKLQNDFASSNLAAVTDILDHAPARSLTRLSLEGMRADLAAEVRHIRETPELQASTALFFSGRPVLGSRGIESEFASKALGTYQDIVTKLFALRSKGALGERGVVPDRDQSRLHVTGIVRGSFGFLMEDAQAENVGVAPALKEAVDDSARLLGSFVEEDEENFESAIVDIDDRVLQTVRSFFDILSKDSATLRIVSGDSERTFDMNGIARATERARATLVQEVPETISGLLQGVMPEKHEFELRAGERTIAGKVAGLISADRLISLFQKGVEARFNRTDVTRGGRIVRQKFEMIEVEETNAAESEVEGTMVDDGAEQQAQIRSGVAVESSPSESSWPTPNVRTGWGEE